MSLFLSGESGSAVVSMGSPEPGPGCDYVEISPATIAMVMTTDLENNVWCTENDPAARLLVRIVTDNFYLFQPLYRWDTFPVPQGKLPGRAWLHVNVNESVFPLTVYGGYDVSADWYDWGASCDPNDIALQPPADALSAAGSCGVSCVGSALVLGEAYWQLDNVSSIHPDGSTYLRLNVGDGIPDGDHGAIVDVGVPDVPEGWGGVTLLVEYCAPPATELPTDTPTDTPTGTPSDTPTTTATSTATPTSTATDTPSDTATRSPSVTATPTRTPTSAPTRTSTRTPTNTRTSTNTRTATPTRTPSNTRTQTGTATATATDTATGTATDTATETPTRTPTDTATATPSMTPTVTRTSTPSPTDSPTPGPAGSCDTSIALVSGVPVLVNAVGFGSGVAPSCGNNSPRHAAWFAYTTDESGAGLQAETAGSEYDTILAVYTGTCGSLSEVGGACNDDANDSLLSLVSLSATAPNTTYYMVVTSYGEMAADLTMALWSGATPTATITPTPVESNTPTETPTPTASPTPASTFTPGGTVVPVIAIDSPADETLTNQASLTVSGQVLDAESVTVNGSAAAVDGQVFSAEVSLAEGPNTITAEAVVGENTASDSVEVTLDTTAPAAPSATRIRIANVSRGEGAVIGSFGSVEAGAQVTVTNTRTGRSATATANECGEFAGSLKIQSGDVLTIFQADAAGNTGPAITRQAGAVSVHITSPLNGTIVEGDSVTVSGYFNGPANTGVVVNGRAAITEGTSFFAEAVPLEPGENAIEATASDPEGNVDSEGITVIATEAVPVLTLSVYPGTGVDPLEVGFEYRFTLDRAVAGLAMDYDGDGSDDFASTDPQAVLQHTYATPGLYTARLTVTDAYGEVHTATALVQVRTLADMEAMFQGIWSGMNAALAVGDVDTALRYLTAGAQEKYARVFTDLLEDPEEMPALIASYSALQRSEIMANVAEYAVNRTIDGRDRMFFIYFLRDTEGVWRVDEM